MDKARKNLQKRGSFEPVKRTDVMQEISQRPEFIVIGQNFGQRCLLENQTVKNYIRNNKVKFCDRLGINVKKTEIELRDVLFKQQQAEAAKKQVRSIALKQQYKFCQKCFEAD